MLDGGVTAELCQNPVTCGAHDRTWRLMDHVLTWVDEERQYKDQNFDLMDVALQNAAGGPGVPASEWNKKFATVSYFRGDEAQGQHLAEELRKEFPKVQVEAKPLPRSATATIPVATAGPAPTKAQGAEVLAPAKALADAKKTKAAKAPPATKGKKMQKEPAPAAAPSSPAPAPGTGSSDDAEIGAMVNQGFEQLLSKLQQQAAPPPSGS